MGDYARVYAIKADSYSTIKLIERVPASASARSNFYILRVANEAVKAMMNYQNCRTLQIHLHILYFDKVIYSDIEHNWCVEDIITILRYYECLL